MNKVLKWIGIVLGSLVVLILVLAAVFYLMGSARLNKVYDFPPSNLVLPTNMASSAWRVYVRVAMERI